MSSGQKTNAPLRRPNAKARELLGSGWGTLRIRTVAKDMACCIREIRDCGISPLSFLEAGVNPLAPLTLSPQGSKSPDLACRRRLMPSFNFVKLVIKTRADES